MRDKRDKKRRPRFKQEAPVAPRDSALEDRPEQTAPIQNSMIYGRNTVISYLENELNSDSSSINKIFVLESAGNDPRLKRIQDLAKQLKVQLHTATRERIEYLLQDENANHQGVVASLSPVELKSLEDLEQIIESEQKTRAQNGLTLKGFTIVAVDGVEDPRNLGAIIRTAEVEGAHAVIIPERRAAGITDIVAKTSAGALAHIPIVRVTNMVKSLNRLKKQGFWVLGLTPYAKEHIYRLDLGCPLVLVVGSEGKGMSRLVEENCDLLGKIPSLGKTESLNVSVALGIGLYEIVRQNNL